MIDHCSSILNVIADDKAVDADKSASITSDYESDDTVWVVSAVLYCSPNLWYLFEELAC